MADIELVHESTDGYTEHGHTVFSTVAYIKVQRSFRLHALRQLRGAPLSVYFDIALADEPPDVQTICEDTGIKSTATICRVLDFLVEHFFIEEIGRAGAHGVKRYRPLSYAWSGSDRHAPGESRISKNEIRRETSKSEIRPQKVKSDAPKRRQKVKSDARIVDVENLQNTSKRKKVQQTTLAREILRELGIAGKPLQRLAESVSEETARAWAEWLERAPSGLRNPQGVIVNALLADPEARPPAPRPGEIAAPRRPRIIGKLAPVIGSAEGEAYEEQQAREGD